MEMVIIKTISWARVMLSACRVDCRLPGLQTSVKQAIKITLEVTRHVRIQLLVCVKVVGYP